MTASVEHYRKVFFEETAEHLADVEAGLLGMESDPHDAALIDQVFRGVHSIKGGASTFGVDAVADFSHSLESHLDRIRSGKRQCDSESLEAMLRSIDCLRALVEAARSDEPLNATVSQCIAEIRDTLTRDAIAEPIKTCDGSPSELNPQTRVWRIAFKPGLQAFQNGLDPTLIWRELDRFGDLDVRLDAEELPRLEDLDPASCCLSWEATLETDRPEKEIQEAFFFCGDDAEVTVEAESNGLEDTGPATLDRIEAESREKNAVPPCSFSGWLVERGIVTSAQALDAMDRQHELNVPVGQLAIREGVMDVHQVFETLDWSSANGERFGETAISLGYLTSQSLAGLLDLQVQERPSLCKLLVQMGAASAETLREELRAYREAGGVVAEHEALIVVDDCTESGEASEPVNATPSFETETGPSLDLEKVKQNGELLGDFLSDYNEHLESAEKQALLIEKDATAEEPLHALYRAFHTLKGVSSFFGLTQITNLAHAAEDLLNLGRDGKLVLKDEPFELVLSTLDSLRRLVECVPDLLHADEAPPADVTAATLIAQLRCVVAGGSPCECAKEAAKRSASTAAGAAAPESTTPTDQGAVGTSPAQELPRPAERASPIKAGGDHEMKETVRVDRGRLDQLIDMIGELVIGEAMVRQEVSEKLPDDEVGSVDQLGRTVRELQEMGLSLRMVPIAATFQKMHRIVRDISRKLHKQVRFEVRGEDTELDKTMVDQLSDPLMHMVRNAVDHGIEPPEARAASGKSSEGRVLLQAYLQNGNFYIELTDDGRGLDRQAILKEAEQRGVISPSDGEVMPDADVWQLILAPGFSTAAEVTDVSGRGVGMDVVKRGVEALNGSIEIESTAGRGSVFRMRLPLTMAIVDGLSVSLAEETFILPLVSVVESIRPQASEIKTIVGRGEVVQVRGATIPLVRLHRIFNRPARELDPSRALVVIVESDGRQLAILVDELLGHVQAVMKSLESNYQKVPGIAGATILGDGEVAFILDVQGLAKLHAGTRSDRPPAVASAAGRPSEEESEQQYYD